MQVKPAPGIRYDRRYSLLSVAYLTGIYWLSSFPGLGAPAGGPLVALVSNLSHAPLFAGLAFCVLKSLSGAQEVSGARYGLAFVVSAVCAALDEWHQSFVPGRLASAGDFLVDVAGIGGMLVLLRLRAPRDTSSPWWKSGVAPRRARRPAGKARRLRIWPIFDGGATQPAGMHRPSNAVRLPPRAARPVRSASLEGSTTAWRQVMKRITEGRSVTSLWLVATMLVCAAGS